MLASFCLSTLAKQPSADFTSILLSSVYAGPYRGLRMRRNGVRMYNRYACFTFYDGGGSRIVVYV
jgi:hypothetical protein